MISSDVQEKINQWLNSSIDQESKNEILRLQKEDPKELLESFYTDLDFGTGGLRGVMGVGSNRVNKYSIGIATQGLANYLKKQFSRRSISVAIAYDSRNNSSFFARTAAGVLSANGIKVKLFSELRPTPLLSFAVRQLECQAGIVITASHNPPEYNGYKVYWEDGAQVLPPHDKGIIGEVRAIGHPDDVNFKEDTKLIEWIDSSVEKSYQEKLQQIILSKEEIKQAGDLKIVYTSIHGSGITMVPKALEDLGFSGVTIVESQAVPDGNFPTVTSPNPEEKEALDLALEQAEALGADLVLGTDPDADRVGIAVRDDEGNLILLNGNQTGALLVAYQIQRRKEKGLMRGNEYVAKTIVTTDLISDLAKKAGIPCYETLTGFKYIAEVIGKREGKEHFIGGGEESYGYLVDEFVRDKDAVLSAVVISEIAAYAKAQKSSLYQMLMDVYAQNGLYHEELVSITIKGMDGVEKIKEMMRSLRTAPPKTLGGSQVVEIRDIANGIVTNVLDGSESKISLPSSNVLQFILADGSKISARPSGTEPKIKFYFSIKEKFHGSAAYKNQRNDIKSRIDFIRKELGV